METIESGDWWYGYHIEGGHARPKYYGVCYTCTKFFLNLDQHKCPKLNPKPVKPVKPVNPDPPPLCECGCGQPVKSKQAGIWSRWRVGHHYQRRG